MQTSHWLDFSPAFWLFLILRAQQLLSRDFRKSLWVCTYTKCIVYLCKADGQKDFHANLKRFVLNIVKSFQKLFLNDNHFLFPFSFSCGKLYQKSSMSEILYVLYRTCSFLLAHLLSLPFLLCLLFILLFIDNVKLAENVLFLNIQL